MGTDIYLVVKTETLPRLPAEVRDYIEIDEEHGYSLMEIRDMIGNFKANETYAGDGDAQGADDEFLKACEAHWEEQGWDADVGANFLVSY